ncbi:unnamed protein product [Agarophyton chilense]|eukprot:gb/GEZJ01003299.1/.p1 GENE.gb/GEZJ01003299.1/~~gb/GEZJ01003299.1/.p1  ORF type:complete len:392 (+),score=67.93 gb/GEZJ01003299.1/:385-1560(+)
MWEGRTLPENASTASEDSIKAPPPFDPSHVKLGPGALPPDAFDPLKQKPEEWAHFWKVVDDFFQPINLDDVRFLRSIPVNPYGGLHDANLRFPLLSNSLKASNCQRSKHAKGLRTSVSSSSTDPEKQNGKRSSPQLKSREASPLARTQQSSDINSITKRLTEVDPESLKSSLNSFPYTQRLIAAMLDEDPSGTPHPCTPSARSARAAHLMEDTFYLGQGSDTDSSSFQVAMETRVKLELIENGLLDESLESGLDAALRQEQWRLRDFKMTNRMRKTSLFTRIIGIELRHQAFEREVKRHDDHVEIAYLEKMIGNMKKNKKSRSKYQKMMQKMFGRYKEHDKISKSKKSSDTMSNGRTPSGCEERRVVAKKKKRKSETYPSVSTKATKRGSQ